MPIIIEYLLKVSIALALVYLFYQLVLRRLTFYNWNRWYLIGYSVLCFLIPFMNITDFLFKHELDEAQFVRMVPVYNLNLPVKDGGFEWNSWNTAIVILIAGMLLMGLRMLLQFFSLLKMQAKAKLLNDGDVKLFHVEDHIMPFSFNNGIYINSRLHTEAELQEIIRHEFVHVKQKHSIDILFAELLCMLLWFHPAAWLIRKAIRQNLEFIADEKVLQDGVDKKQYQYLLLKVIGNNHYSIASNFNFSSLKNRIIMMNQIKSARVQAIRFLFILPLVAVLLLAFRKVNQKDHRKDFQQQLLQYDTIPITEIASININKNGNEETITIVLKNGTTDTYNLNDPKQKELFKKKYGKVENLAPNPPLSTAVIQSDEVESVDVSSANGKDILRIRLKNGTVETFDLNNEKDKETLRTKYKISKEVTSSSTSPASNQPLAITVTPVKETVKLNKKGYYVSIADDMGECVVIVKDKNKKIIEALMFTDWQAAEAKYEAKYGEILPPPPPAQPATLTAVGYPSRTSSPAAVMLEATPATINAAEVTSPVKEVTVTGHKKVVFTATTDTDAKTITAPEPGVVTVIGYSKSTKESGNIKIKNGNDNVLYIIDGKEATSEDINALNPNTIESISVLKDNSAVKLYGEKGKNGVIIIKTKKKVTTYQFFTNPFQAKDSYC
jgi:TonB-dependent SusC/RagA subfamily outer membrane receptor